MHIPIHRLLPSLDTSECRSQEIEVTRSRAYKKNDQAFVEQKNGAVVRRLVGYGRFDGAETAQVMARLGTSRRIAE